MKTETIEHILEIGTDLMLKHGYHSVGLNRILSVANIPKGSFYYYFKSKEDFGLQVIEYYSRKSLLLLNSYLNDESKNSKERIISFFEDRLDAFESNGFKEGCLLGNCSAELADFSESFSISIANELSNWREAFENCIQEGQEKGNIKTDESAKILSDLVLTTWEGTLLRMKSSKSADSIKTFIQFLDKHLL